MNVTTMELITPFTVVKGTQICMVRNGPVNREDEPVALSTNLNFKLVVGCQVFWPLKLWYFVWYVLKTKDIKGVGFGKYVIVWPDIGDIDSVERLRVKILPEPQIERWTRIVELE